jgi:hypothetical protein
VQVNTESEMADLIRFSLRHLDELETAFIQDYYLREPRVTLADFAEQWCLSATDLTELRCRVMQQLRDTLATKRIRAFGDII